jgi:hypothetical protein
MRSIRDARRSRSPVAHQSAGGSLMTGTVVGLRRAARHIAVPSDGIPASRDFNSRNVTRPAATSLNLTP